MSLLSKFKKENLRDTYVSALLTVVDTTVSVLGKVMPHLLEVKGIDPKTKPGDLTQRLLVNALSGFEQPDAHEEYTEDFDFNPLVKAFSKTSNKLEHLHLTRQKFAEMTDLNKWGNAKQAVVVDEDLEDFDTILEDSDRKKAKEYPEMPSMLEKLAVLKGMQERMNGVRSGLHPQDKSPSKGISQELWDKVKEVHAADDLADFHAKYDVKQPVKSSVSLGAQDLKTVLRALADNLEKTENRELSVKDITTPSRKPVKKNSFRRSPDPKVK